MEGTMYAVITSVSNAGGFLGSMFGALTISALNITSTNFDNLWIICTLSNVFIIIPMALLWIINFDKGIEVTKKAHINEEDVHIFNFYL